MVWYRPLPWFNLVKKTINNELKRIKGFEGEVKGKGGAGQENKQVAVVEKVKVMQICMTF